jgi:vitamin B12 transporter
MYDAKAQRAARLLKPIPAAMFAACAALPQLARAQNAGVERPEEIVVTSSMIPQSRRQLGTAVSVIDFEDIELRGYRDIAEVLRTQAGIGVSNSGGPGKASAVRVRGEDSYRTLLIIDGVKALDPSSTQVSPNFDSLLATSDLQRVEVLRGPQGFIYGADAGGVINIITKRGEGPFGGQAGLEFGDSSTRKLDAALSGGSDEGDFFVSVADLETEGFNARTDDTVLRDDDGADNTTLHAKLGWNVFDGLRLQLVARDIDADAQYDRCNLPVTFDVVHDCRGTTEQTTYKVSAEHAAGGVTNSFGYSNIDIVRDNFAQGSPAFGSDGQLRRLEYTGSYRPSDAVALVYGLDFQDEELVDVDGPRSRDKEGYYFEYQGVAEDAVFWTLGARYDASDDFGSHTSTRMSIAYVQELDAGRSLKYRTSIGTGFRAPSLYEIAYNFGNFTFPPAQGVVLKEESSEGFDVGVEYQGRNGLHLELTYFDQEIEDEVFFDLVNFSGYLQSMGISKSTGIEIAADVPLGDRWQLLVNWTNNEADDVTDEPRLRRPEDLGNIGLAYRAMNERLSLLANYRIARDAVDSVFGAFEPLPDYEVFDLSMNYNASESFSIFGRVQNATDETYQEVVGYNAAERSIYGGVRFRF